MAALLALLLLMLPGRGAAVLPGFGNPPPWLDHWAFNQVGTWASDYGYPPADFTNIAGSDLGDFFSVVVDSTNNAWLHYNISQPSGTNELKIDTGSVVLWYAPHWSSTNEGGTGPGEWSRLLEVGSYTTNASYGFWSLYVDPEGANIYFSAQSNDGSGGTYLSAPIDFATNYWHLISLTYSSSNSSLYLDGELVTNGLPVTVWPSADVLSNGFYLGSSSNGMNQMHGMCDDLYSYDFPIDADMVAALYWSRDIFYYGNPNNRANLISAPSQPNVLPIFNAITGPGYLIQLSNTVSCVTNTGVWITNVVVTSATNGTRNLAFTIQGGSEFTYYDVFANSVLDFSTNTARAWAWMGQGYHCATYLLTNLPSSGSVFLVLGSPTDADGDGLTTAYEVLVSKTSPTNPDTDGDGISDSWEVLLGLNPLVNDNAQPASRSNFSYDLTEWLEGISGVRTGSVSLDAEGNVLSVSQ